MPKRRKQFQHVKTLLAIVGGLIIIISANVSQFGFFSQTDIYNYLIPAAVGVLLILPFVIDRYKS